MHLWLTPRSDVPIPEQIATQIILGILGRDLPPGQRLPSTRALARRFNIHPNTVSTAYRRLEVDGWVEPRQGSGVYVRKAAPAHATTEQNLDIAIAQLFASARKQGIAHSQLHARLHIWLQMQPPDHFLLLEPDEELRRIVLHELRAQLQMPVEGHPLDACGRPQVTTGAVAVVLPSKAEAVRLLLPPEVELIPLRVRSAPSSLAAYLPASPESLVAIASRWDAFRHLAQTMLTAAGFNAEAFVVRDAREAGWMDGLEQTAGVVCDSVTAIDLAGKARVVCFPIVAAESLDELRKYEQLVQDTALLEGPMSEDAAENAPENTLQNGAVEKVTQTGE